jgi:alpha 1,4-glycosyltransferase
MDQLPDLHSLWIGRRLTWLEQLCLASWLAHGHRAVLWTYHPVEGAPHGVEMRNAREILPESAITFHYFKGSVSLFSNRFRYHLCQRHRATWLDTDVLLLRPLADPSPYLFAWEHPDSICSAVLRLPSGSGALRDLLALTDARVPVPHWWPLKDRTWQHLRGLVGQHQTATDMDWGTFGPRALTETLQRHRLTDRALPCDTFYPILWMETALFYGPADIVEARLTERTIAVHLWSTSGLMSTPEVEKKRNAPPPSGNWIAGKCAAYGVDIGQELATFRRKIDVFGIVADDARKARPAGSGRRGVGEPD